MLIAHSCAISLPIHPEQTATDRSDLFQGISSSRYFSDAGLYFLKPMAVYATLQAAEVLQTSCYNALAVLTVSCKHPISRRQSWVSSYAFEIGPYRYPTDSKW